MSDFTVLLNQLQCATPSHSQLVFSSSGSRLDLLGENGSGLLCGFRENQLVRDNGLTASLEWRVPIFVNEAGYSRWNLTAIPFIDYGRSWDEDSNLSTSKAAELSSVGLGIRWQPREYINASLYYGERIDDDDVTKPEDNDLQDDGFHVAVFFQWPFD
ncbi:MAG: BamA/TamA family outer membrane protein [Pseudohongiellaceae bacterium]